MIRISLVVCTLVLLCTSAVTIIPAEKGSLRAGAARIDITPPADAGLSMSGYEGRAHGFEGIHDNIFVRAIVVDDGSTQGAMVAVEVGSMAADFVDEASQRVTKTTGIPRDHLIVAAVHTHSAPGTKQYRDTPFDLKKQGPFIEKVRDAIVESVRQAKSSLQPARVGFGEGKAYVNVNRREYFADRGWWWLGHNLEAVSDKTLAVVKFESMSGKPIALFINYPVHAVVMGSKNYRVSGDLAGATSRFVEQYYQGRKEDAPRGDAGYAIRLRPGEISDGVVAIWTSGTAGDQNPIAMSDNEDFTMVNAFGKILGEEAVRVANNIKTATGARIRGAQRVVTCPGGTLGPGPRKEYKFEESPEPVQIRLSLLEINDTALMGISGEVLTNIGLHLKKDSPFSHTIVVTHANGASGYIPSDSLFDRQVISYENSRTPLGPGCAENAIVDGFLDMIGRP